MYNDTCRPIIDLTSQFANKFSAPHMTAIRSCLTNLYEHTTAICSNCRSSVKTAVHILKNVNAMNICGVCDTAIHHVTFHIVGWSYFQINTLFSEYKQSLCCHGNSEKAFIKPAYIRWRVWQSYIRVSVIIHISCEGRYLTIKVWNITPATYQISQIARSAGLCSSFQWQCFLCTT